MPILSLYFASDCYTALQLRTNMRGGAMHHIAFIGVIFAAISSVEGNF